MSVYFMFSRYCILLIGLACSCLSHADIISDKLAQELSSQPVWQKLLHLQNGQPDITTSTFYLVQGTSLNPKSELLATIDALLEPATQNHNEHAQCVFRARYYWLRSQTFWQQLSPPEVVCDEYLAWSNEGSIDSASMILATGYLSNPASFFGHMLFKFNSNQEQDPTNLLDLSINYGAIVPPQENMIRYIAKGLFGGYDAAFTDGTYYEHDHNYTNIDLRDVWEYQLDLTETETQLLIAHSWELLNNKFDYFYLTENCAYRIGELLEVILDKPLFDKDAPWVMPVEIFRNLEAYQHRGKPIVKKVERNLSRQNDFYEKLEQLSTSENKLLKALVEDTTYLDHPNYKMIDAKQRIRVVDVLFDYYEIRIQDDASNVALEEDRRRLLKEMLSLSFVTSQPKWQTKVKQPPHLSQKPTSLRVGSIQRGNDETGYSISFRPAYFDFLTPEIGIMPYSKLQMFNIELEVFGDTAKLERLDIIDIANLGLPNSGLPGDRPLAWNVSFGLDRPDLFCSGCLTEKLEGGLGKALSINSDLVIYGFLQGRLQGGQTQYSHLSGGIKSGVLIDLSPSWKFHIEHELRDYIDTHNDPDNRIKISSRLGQSTDWDIRLSYEKQGQEKLSASIGYFF